MDKHPAGKPSWWQAHRPTTRRLVQLYAALLHNAYIKGFIDGKIYEGSAKALCFPGFNCYSCPGAVAGCPLGSIQNVLSAMGHKAPWYVLGIIMLFGVCLGRTICGWLCPLGLIQELLHRIPTPKIRKSKITRALTWAKYVFLAVFVLAIPVYYGLSRNLPVPGFCKYICPAGTLEGAVGHLANPGNASMYQLLGILFTRKWVILIAIGLACVFCYRSFCRFVCPLGAIYGLFNRFNIIGVKLDPDRCNGCGACVRHCGMDVSRVGDRECIHCGACLEHCAQGALSIKAGKILLKSAPLSASAAENRTSPGRVLWGIALAVLCFALIWFNFLDPSVQKDSVPVSAPPAAVTETPADEKGGSTAPVGHDIGNRLEDFSLKCYDGSEYHLADTRGKVVFINRWATWCTPCVNELPYFNELFTAHREDVCIIAVHSSMITQDPAEFIAPYGYEISFATDEDGDPVKKIVGGSDTLPQTVVLNRNGEVIYNSEKSVTPELLEALYQKGTE